MIDGSRQDGRFPPALSPQSIRVDETPLADRVAMTRDYANALTFLAGTGPVDIAAQADGTWGELFDRDESALIARSLALRLDSREQTFLDDFAASRSRRMAQHLSELAGWLDHWLQALAQLGRPEARAMGERIERRILRVLGPDWRAATRLEPPPSTSLMAHQMRGWLAPLLGSDADADEPPPSPRALRVIFFTLLEAIQGAQGIAGPELLESLKSGAHEPAAALLLALIQTYARVQERINQFTARHLDFYYHDCLQLAPLGATPDSVHLVFGRDPTFQSEVIVPAGQPFTAGRTATGETVMFQAAGALTVTDAKVAALKTLRLERDAMISPEREFHLVTRAKVAEFGADVGPEDVLQRDTAALMGGNVLGCIPNDQVGRIGLAVSSPILWLKEGERRIELTIEFGRPAGAAKAELIQTLQGIQDPGAGDDFFTALGELFAAWLLCDDVTLDDQEIEDLRTAATRKTTGPFIDPARLGDGAEAGDANDMFATDPLFLMLGKVEGISLEDRRTLARDELFASFFKIEVSTATGWFEIASPVPVPSKPAGSAAVGLIGLCLDLTNEDPAVVACSPAVHGPGWPVDAPVLRLTIRHQSRLYPLSLFDQVRLEAIGITVAVQGLRDLRAFNQLGQLDPSKPFQPFGPLPDLSSYVVIGAQETARKQLTQYAFALDWAGLPANGFEDYYDDYGLDLTDGSFTVAQFILRDGRWMPAGADQPLFRTTSGALDSSRVVAMDGPTLTAYWRPTERPLVFDQNARNGFVKLQLSAPAVGFGQSLYPTVLSRSLRASVKNGQQQPLPSPPYVPILAGLTLSYVAETRIEVGVGIAAGAAPGHESVLHLHPFGMEVVCPPATADRAPMVLPRFGRDGHLMIGLSASQLAGELTLLFELRGDTATESLARARPQTTLEWSWLAGDLWTPLDSNRVVEDTTMGFLTTGVVRLDLPAGMATGNSILPGDLYWLRVCSDWRSDSFAGLQGVHAQAVLATRVLGQPPLAALPPTTITLKSASIPGVLSLLQPARGFGLRRAETAEQERTRIGERLRHKLRASTPWDYERLVLEAFPRVYKVKCLPNTAADTGEDRPGEVLIVVVPAAPRNDPAYSTRALQLDALELERIAAFLPPLASPFARINVRSASYERIQVRCLVELEPRAHFGDVLKRINAALVDYLSPWRDGGHEARFDWTIRADDVEACIRAVENVRSVAGISLIRIWEAEGSMTNPFYYFDDTAVEDASSPADPQAPVLVRARRPWSLALPMSEHIIEVLGAETDGDGPRKTGVAAPDLVIGAGSVAGLQIGSTFIVGGAS